MGSSRGGEGAGSNVLVLLILLAALGGGGAWNYQRNVELEKENQGARPFKGYSNEALEQMAAAYQEEADRLNRKYRASLTKRNGVRDQGGLIDERVAEYDRVRRVGEEIRDATSLAAQSEARLREIRDEQSFRGPEGWELHLKRLTSI